MKQFFLIVPIACSWLINGFPLGIEAFADQSSEIKSGSNWMSSTQLLSGAVQGFIEIPHFGKLIESAGETGPGKLLRTEEMQPFKTNVSTAIDEWLSRRGGGFAVRFSDLREIATGEVVFAWMTATEQRHPYRICLMVDTRGKEREVQKVLDRVKTDLKKRGSEEKSKSVEGTTITTLTIPAKAGRLDTDHVAYALSAGRLLVADREDVVGEFLASVKSGGVKSSLLNAEDYTGLQQHLEHLPEPHLRWFARPMGMMTIIRDRMRQGEVQDQDIVGLLIRQGFDQLKAGGGELQFGAQGHDLLHRAVVYAPTPPKQSERFRLAAKMLNFPNASIESLPAWLRVEAASAMRWNWNLKEAFWALEPIVNDVTNDNGAEENTFRDVLNSIVNDNQIDIANDLVEHLGERLLMVTDNTQPSAITSERTLIAIPLKNTPTITRTIARACEQEPGVQKSTHRNVVIWEIQNEEENPDEANFRNFGFGAPNTKQQQSQPVLEKWAVAVYQDHLLVSSHVTMIQDLMDGPEDLCKKNQDREGPILKILRGFVKSESSILRWTDPTIAWRVKYDLLRDGKLKDSTSVLASLLRRANDELEKSKKSGEEDKLLITGGTLPSFQFAAPYFGLLGTVVETKDVGWQMTNVMLAPEK